jgi:hypothetical protein
MELALEHQKCSKCNAVAFAEMLKRNAVAFAFALNAMHDVSSSAMDVLLAVVL